jgi:hypothetical protein
MREFVHQNDSGLACDDGVDVHLFESDTPILGAPQRNLLEIPDEDLGLRAAVRFDIANDNVDALALEKVGFFEHLISLSDAGSSSQIHAQARSARLLLFGKQRFGARSSVD